MLPSLADLTAAALPEELLRVVKEKVPRTNTLRVTVLVFQEKKDKNFVRLRIRSNLRSLLQLMQAWRVPESVRDSASAISKFAMGEMAKQLSKEITDKLMKALDAQGISRHVQSSTVRWTDTIKPVEHPTPDWGDVLVDEECYGYDISESAWDYDTEYEHADLHDEITEEVVLTCAEDAWLDAKLRYGSTAPQSQEWTIRDVVDIHKPTGPNSWFKIFYVEKEVTTMLAAHVENARRVL
jgi:hypothetical protein